MFCQLMMVLVCHRATRARRVMGNGRVCHGARTSWWSRRGCGAAQHTERLRAAGSGDGWWPPVPEGRSETTHTRRPLRMT